METSFALLAICVLSLCAGNPRVTVNSPLKGQWREPLMFFFDLPVNKRLSKQPRRRWFGTPSRSLWRQYNSKAFSQSMSDVCHQLNQNTVQQTAVGQVWPLAFSACLHKGLYSHIWRSDVQGGRTDGRTNGILYTHLPQWWSGVNFSGSI